MPNAPRRAKFSPLNPCPYISYPTRISTLLTWAPRSRIELFPLLSESLEMSTSTNTHSVYPKLHFRQWRFTFVSLLEVGAAVGGWFQYAFGTIYWMAVLMNHGWEKRREKGTRREKPKEDVMLSLVPLININIARGRSHRRPTYVWLADSMSHERFFGSRFIWGNWRQVQSSSPYFPRRFLPILQKVVD